MFWRFSASSVYFSLESVSGGRRGGIGLKKKKKKGGLGLVVPTDKIPALKKLRAFKGLYFFGFFQTLFI